MPLQDLKDAAGMLQRKVGVLGLNRLLLSRLAFFTRVGFARAPRRFGLHVLIHPRFQIVFSLFLIPTAEEAVTILGVFVFLSDDGRGIRVVDDVILEVVFVLD